MGQAMPLIALPIFAPQRTADAAALKMQPAYRPKNFGRIKSCSSAYHGLLDLPQTKGFPADSLQPFLRRSRKGAYVFFLRLPAHIADYLFSLANPAALHARHIFVTGDSDVPSDTRCPQFSEEKRHKTF